MALGNSTLTASGGPGCMGTAVHSSPGDLFVVNITMLNIMVTGAPEPGTRRPEKRKPEGRRQGQRQGRPQSAQPPGPAHVPRAEFAMCLAPSFTAFLPRLSLVHFTS